MATKHEQILAHIEELPVGERISVRGIAKALNVSDGTNIVRLRRRKRMVLFQR